MCLASKRWRYIVTSSLNGWAHTQNDPWTLHCNSIANTLEILQFCTSHRYCIHSYHTFSVSCFRSLMNSYLPRPARANPFTNEVDAPLPTPKVNTLQKDTETVYFTAHILNFITVTYISLLSYPGYFREHHSFSMGLPEISRVTWQVWLHHMCVMASQITSNSTFCSTPCSC